MIFGKLRLCFGLVLFAATVAHADILHLKGGKKLEGKIISETSKSVQIKTRYGTNEVERSQIEKIERKNTPREDYEDRKKALKSNDINGLFELAIFCKDNKLTKEHRALLKDILKLEPQHDGANTELGNIKYEGEWFSKEGLAEYQDKQRKQMEELGMILYNGKWMSEEEMMIAKGFVLVDGQWLPQAEADRLKAEKDFQDIFGLPLTISESDNFSVRNLRTNDDNQYLLDLFEDSLDYFKSLAIPTETELKFFDKFKTHVYILNEVSHVRQFIESGYIKRYYPPKNTTDRYLDTDNFSYFFPRPFVVLSLGRHLRGSDDRETSLIGMSMVHIGQIFIRRLKRGGGMPGWVEAGVAHHFEGIYNNYQTISVIEYPWYEPYVDKWIEGWESFPLWRKNLAKPDIHERLPTLRSLMDRPIEEMRIDALAKSWSVVTFLLQNKRELFFEFIRKTNTKFRGEEITPTIAFEQVFGEVSIEQIEAEWRAWLVAPPDERTGTDMPLR